MLLPRSIHLVPALLLALGGVAYAEDELTIDQVPAPVAATLRAQAGSAAIDEVEAKQQHGKTVYEAEIHKQGGTVNLVIAADGAVVSSESQGDVTAMPAAVQAAINKAFSGKGPKTGEIETSGTGTTYVVEDMIGYDTVEIRFAADGSERSREVQHAGEHEDEDIEKGDHEDGEQDDGNQQDGEHEDGEPEKGGQVGKEDQHGHQDQDGENR